MSKIKLGQHVKKKTITGEHKIGRICYIHSSHGWYEVEFAGAKGTSYRETFYMNGGD